MSQFVIGRRQLFILPTRIGWYFSFILIALFAIAIKFDNQAAFMMLFILISVGLVTMIYTHNNMIGLEINTQVANSVFTGEIAHFPIQLHNHSDHARHSIWVICDGFRQLIDLPNGEHKQLSLSLPTVRRGYLNCSVINLTSQYPLGLFFCWSKRFESTQRCIVYPQPLELFPFPESGNSKNQKTSQYRNTTATDDLSGMKDYQPGDRLRDIHWPSLAKTQKLITKEHEDQSGDSVNLSWFSLPSSLGVEDKLSVLCGWIIEADRRAIRYQLEMPNHTIEFSSGLNHYHKCLSVLALWENEDSKTTSSNKNKNKKGLKNSNKVAV